MGAPSLVSRLLNYFFTSKPTATQIGDSESEKLKLSPNSVSDIPNASQINISATPDTQPNFQVEMTEQLNTSESKAKKRKKKKKVKKVQSIEAITDANISNDQ